MGTKVKFMTLEKQVAMSDSSRLINDKGVVLISALLFMAIITVAGTSAFFTSSNELTISGNYKRLKQSFYDAEAGVAYTLAIIEKDLEDGIITLTNSTETISTYSAPTGYSFTPVTTLTQVGVGTNTYRFQVTGNEGGTSTTIEIVFERNSQLPYGLFGDTKLEIKLYNEVYSYDSTAGPPADPGTGKANMGCNGDGDPLTEDVLVDNWAVVGGDIDLGMGPAPGNTPATEDIHAGATLNGIINNVGRVDPDPLGAGVSGSDLDNNFTTYSDPLNYNNGDAGIGETLNMTLGQTVDLVGETDSDGSNFYFTDVSIAPGATLNINASAGPVNIYMDGPLSADLGSRINITGPTTNVSIFSKSTDRITLEHTGDFKGMIYAPFSDIEVKNNFGQIFGTVWGKTVEIQNIVSLIIDPRFYLDTAIMAKWMDDTVSITSWKDTRYD